MTTHANWNYFMKSEASKQYYVNLMQFLASTMQTERVYPIQEDWFKALDLCPLDRVKVVILGQDPYHDHHQAMGLAFSVFKDSPLPPSLKNIYKELCDDLNCPYPAHGNLESWATQGVLLLNTCLTVNEHQANSHRDAGWQIFTKNLLTYLVENKKNLVFILWGKQALKMTDGINLSEHCLICSAHPSPLSSYRGFFGSKPFSKCNQYLIDHNQSPINWVI